ncbi:ATP-binding protein [Azotosporobacter soli]|uniref:ATP-binding protein n=1 Tax=Azotosporobacter soli TaxID=3055040 RepID=UPI0031FF357B
MQKGTDFSLQIPYRIELLSLVTSFVGEAAQALGANGHETQQLRLAAEEVFSYIMEAFPASETNEVFHLQAQEDGEAIRYHFSNHGTPINVRATPEFDASDLDATLDGLGFSLVKQLTDHFECINCGNDGWSITFSKRLSAFRSLLSSPVTEAAAPSQENLGLRVRQATADDATQLIGLIYRTYRYSYLQAELYDDKALRTALEKRQLIALAALTGEGEMIGCGIIHFKEAHFAELGTLMTAPDYRTTSAVTLLVKELYRLLRDDSFKKVYFCANFVTTHTYSQRLMHTLKMVTMGLKLSVHERAKFIGINEEKGQRESYVFAVRKMEDSGRSQTFHAPQEHQEIIGRLLCNVGVSHNWGEAKDASMLPLQGKLIKEPCNDIQLMDLQVDAFGADFATVLKQESVAMQQDGFLTCFLSLPLDQPQPRELALLLKANKYFFSGLQLKADGRWYLLYANLFHQRFQFYGIELHDPVAQELRRYVEAEYLSLY